MLAAYTKRSNMVTTFFIYLDKDTLNSIQITLPLCPLHSYSWFHNIKVSAGDIRPGKHRPIPEQRREWLDMPSTGLPAPSAKRQIQTIFNYFFIRMVSGRFLPAIWVAASLPQEKARRKSSRAMAATWAARTTENFISVYRKKISASRSTWWQPWLTNWGISRKWTGVTR
jgi:hypothetical protein